MKNAGDMLCIAEASVFSLFFLSVLLPGRKAILRLAAGAAVCAVGVLVICLTFTLPDILMLIFGFLGGMLCGVAVLISHRFLASGDAQPAD